MPDRHQMRIVTGRAFAIHTRSLAPDIDKMNNVVREVERRVSHIFFNAKGVQFDRQLGLGVATAIAYGMEKSSTAGLEAYMREKKVFMKYLGLFRSDQILPKRLDRYLAALNSGGDHFALLREFALGMKLMCPQVATTKFEKGDRQAGWGNYRIRPIVMALYAINTAAERNIEANTDDMVLAPLRFFPPYQRDPVTEAFLMKFIDEYFDRKAKQSIDYEKEFRAMYADVLAERKKNIATDYNDEDFKRKCRNAANDAWCLLIFLKTIGLIEVDNQNPARWSSTQQRYGHTFGVQYQVVRLTADGKAGLAGALDRIPVWYEDITALSPLVQVRDAVTNAVEELAESGSFPVSTVTKAAVTAAGGLEKWWSDDEGFKVQGKEMLEKLGLKVTISEDGESFLAPKKPLFDREYDVS